MELLVKKKNEYKKKNLFMIKESCNLIGWEHFTAQKMKFSIKDFFSKRDQIRSFLQIWSHLLKKSFIDLSFIFYAVFRLLTWEEFFQKWNLHREIENRKTFHFRLLSAQSNNKILGKLKHSKTRRTQKLHFGSILGTFAHFMPESF